MLRPGRSFPFRLLAAAMIPAFLVVASCSENEPTKPPPPPKDLELTDLLGVWHCVECNDPVNPAEVAREDSTLFLDLLPDSVMVFSCRRDSLVWWNFRAGPDTMWISVRGPLTNMVEATFTWTPIDSLDAYRMEISAFGMQVGSEIRRKITGEPMCPEGP